MSLIPSFFGGRRSNVFDPFSLDVWDPFADFFPSTTAFLVPAKSSETSAETAAFTNGRIDCRETRKAHAFKADLPRLKKEEVKVEVEDGNVLRISGESGREKEEKTHTWHRVEWISGKFLSRFRLPANAKVDQVKAALENGVLLIVTVPKAEVKMADVKAIMVN